MTIRDRVREWLGINGIREDIALYQRGITAYTDNVGKRLDRIEALLTPDVVKPAPKPITIPSLDFTDWETIQRMAMHEFDDPKKGN